MANTFKNKVYDGSNTSANALMNVYTAPSATTTGDWFDTSKHDYKSDNSRYQVKCRTDCVFSKTIPMHPLNTWEVIRLLWRRVIR